MNPSPRNTLVVWIAFGTCAAAAACIMIMHDSASQQDKIALLQHSAITRGTHPSVRWGWEQSNYTGWGTHTNRLVPIFTYGTLGAGEGIDLDSYTNENSAYRSEDELRRIFNGRLPEKTLNPDAGYMDQTDIFRIQQAALTAGRKHIFLVVFDGMDWQTLQASAVHNTQSVPYTSGRGTGTHFQEYDAGGTSQYAAVVTSPDNDGTESDVNQQSVQNPGGTRQGGYDFVVAGELPSSAPTAPKYYIGEPETEGVPTHAFTDSASSATSMTTGEKTFNGAIGVDRSGRPLGSVAHDAQDMGYKIGVVTSVPVSHATPAASYAHNVSRDDYQDISRDLLGLPSRMHPEQPLEGLDVVLGGGHGYLKDEDAEQGENYEPGNRYLADSDLAKSSIDAGGRYVVCERTAGEPGAALLAAAAERAASENLRLLGFFGVGPAKGHLPYQTANGDFKPTLGRNSTAENYSTADLSENPTLAQLTSAALRVLPNDKGFWLMVEAGDVDWANHDNNLDNSIGAVNSGDAAVRVITDWVEANSNWQESLLIITADHGHYLVIDDPTVLIAD